MIAVTGEYQVNFYNKYGEQIVRASLTARTLKQATDAADDHLLVPVLYEHSYVILRCVRNSLDKE